MKCLFHSGDPISDKPGRIRIWALGVRARVEGVIGLWIRSRGLLWRDFSPDRLELRAPLSEEGPFQREGVREGGGRGAHAAGPQPLSLLKVTRPEKQEGEHAKE